MRERNREIARRRQRKEKRSNLRKKLAAATTDQQRKDIQAKIAKTFPKYAPPA